MIYLSLSRSGLEVDLVNIGDAGKFCCELGSRLIASGFVATTFYAEGSIGQVKVDIHFPDERRDEWAMRRALAAGVVVAWASWRGVELVVPAPVPLENLIDLEAP